MNNNILSKDLIINILSENKAIDIINFAIKDSSIADNIIIASGTSNRHVRALSEYLLTALKKQGYKNILVEGLEDSNWVLIDVGDEIIHLLINETREFYKLEELFETIATATSHF